MFKKLLSTTALTMFAGSLAFGTASAAGTDPTDSKFDNESPISISGTITAVTEGAFELRYNNSDKGEDGVIVVELDDWDFTDEAKFVEKGEKVTIYGHIDHDLFETRKIEADTVFSHNDKVYYFANSVDEEDFYDTYYVTPNSVKLEEIPDEAWVNIKGKVTEIDGRELTISLGGKDMVIDTDEMPYNPLDKVGLQKIEKGDYIYVSGEMDKNFFDDNEVDAASIITLRDASKSKANNS
ncbi:hypothetical protein [Sneathiella glossodoripedis]|uniref:hypothetical protein n=1 Tax=Sneathiella glossodoripedis TaxID=418853 RepID=UPI00046ED012|nr:hypothetical protein [Sneathiella glossodoripedis]